MPLRVPAEYVDIYMWLASLDDAMSERLLEALNGAEDLSLTGLTDNVCRATGLESRPVKRLLEASLGLLRTIQDSPTDELNRDRPAEIASDLNLKLDERHRGELRSRIARLLQARALKMIAKAVDLQSDHSLLFRSARIYTEVRPMFEEDLHQAPRAAAVTHQLKLEVFEADGHLRTLYLAMDADDLVHLQQVVAREITKIEAVDLMLGRAGIARNILNRED